MDEEIKELLEKDLELNEENNKILKKMEFSGKVSLALGISKWVVVVGSILGISYWLGPQLEAMLNTYKDLLK